MNLRNELKLTDTKIIEINKYPKSPEPSRVLVLSCPLKPSIADVLKCKDMCYDINDNPRQFEGGFGFDYEMVDCEIRLPTSKGALVPLSPKVIKKFRVGHDQKDNLILTLRVHFAGYGRSLEEWSDDINDNAFDCSILSLQGELFVTAPDSKEDGTEGGRRVDLSQPKQGNLEEMVANIARAEHGPADDDEMLDEFGPADGPCVSCANRIPFEDAQKTQHVTGQKCARSAGATLSSAAAAGVGTHQKGTRGRRKMDIPEQSEPEDETLVN